jgi:RNA polymerase primary sigma factor
LKSLSPREAEIVNAYFGLDGENGVTIEQIGQKFDDLLEYFLLLLD